MGRSRGGWKEKGALGEGLCFYNAPDYDLRHFYSGRGGGRGKGGGGRRGVVSR